MDNHAVQIVPEEVVMNKIFVVRGQKVMLDRDLSDYIKSLPEI